MIIYTITCSLLLFLIHYASAEKKVLLIDTNASCIATSCHDTMGKKRYIHKAGLDPMHCNRCHEIVKEGEHTFKKLPEDISTLCARCHSKDIVPPKDIKGSPPKVLSENNKELNLHEPFAKGKCTGCHDAHESDYFKHLKAEYPEWHYATFTPETYALCLNVNCHKGFDRALTEPRTLSDTMFRNGNLNLHFRHINKTKGRACATCHHPHGSKGPFLLKDELLFGQTTLTLQYEKTDTGGGCKTSCHRETKYDRYSPVFNTLKTSPRIGTDASADELKLSKERDAQRQKDKAALKGVEKQ